MSSLIPKLQFLARSLYFSAPSAPQRTREFYQDFARDEQRYGMVSLQHFIIGARASAKAEDRVMLAEIIRGECLVDAPMYSIATLADHELVAQYEADVAFRQWEQGRCRTTRDVWIAKQSVHADTMRRLIDAGHRQ